MYILEVLLQFLLREINKIRDSSQAGKQNVTIKGQIVYAPFDLKTVVPAAPSSHTINGSPGCWKAFPSLITHESRSMTASDNREDAERYREKGRWGDSGWSDRRQVVLFTVVQLSVKFLNCKQTSQATQS